MLLKTFIQKSSNILAENKLLKIAIIALIIINIYTMSKIELALNSYKTVIVPPVINSTFEVMGSVASDEYFKQMARYVASLAFNYTPVIARTQFGELLHLYSPDDYVEGKNALYALADIIEASKVTQSLFISKIELTKTDDKGKIIINGKRKVSDDTKLVIDEADISFGIDYAMKEGKFMIKKIYEEKK